MMPGQQRMWDEITQTSETTLRINNTQHPPAPITPTATNDKLLIQTTEPQAEQVDDSMPTPRRDKEIVAYVQKLEKETRVEKQHDYLTKIRVLLHERMQDKKQTAEELPIPIGPAVVEVMRQTPHNEKAMEECSCILYFVSKLDPAYKKGVARLFKAMGEHKDSIAIQRASCGAIRNVVAANPDSLPRIAPSIGVILQSITRHSGDVKLVATALEILAHLSSHPPSKEYFVSSGAYQHVLAAMKQNFTHAAVQANALKTLANLSFECSSEMKMDMLTCVRPVQRAMKQHSALHPKLALYGCCTLRNLSDMKDVALGGVIMPILAVMQQHLTYGALHEQALAALSKLIMNCPAGDITSMTTEGGISTVLAAMDKNPKNLQLQKDGLGVLLCLTTRVPDYHEVILSEGGLDVVISSMRNFEDDDDLAHVGCEFLKQFSRQSLDLQRAVTAKGGIAVVLTAMRKHIHSIDVQDSAFACMRNICTHKDNRVQVKVDGGVSTMLVTMTVFASDAAIQAYGCDAIGRLAIEPDNQPSIAAENGIDVAIQAMKEHPSHAGVQDRAVFLLFAMSHHQPSLLSMKEKEVLPLLYEAKVPAKKDAIDRLAQLTSRVEKAGRTGWFGLG